MEESCATETNGSWRDKWWWWCICMSIKNSSLKIIFKMEPFTHRLFVWSWIDMIFKVSRELGVGSWEFKRPSELEEAVSDGGWKSCVLVISCRILFQCRLSTFVGNSISVPPVPKRLWVSRFQNSGTPVRRRIASFSDTRTKFTQKNKQTNGKSSNLLMHRLTTFPTCENSRSENCLPWKSTARRRPTLTTRIYRATFQKNFNVFPVKIKFDSPWTSPLDTYIQWIKNYRWKIQELIDSGTVCVLLHTCIIYYDCVWSVIVCM